MAAYRVVNVLRHLKTKRKGQGQKNIIIIKTNKWVCILNFFLTIYKVNQVQLYRRVNLVNIESDDRGQNDTRILEEVNATDNQIVESEVSVTKGKKLSQKLRNCKIKIKKNFTRFPTCVELSFYRKLM